DPYSGGERSGKRAKADARAPLVVRSQPRCIHSTFQAHSDLLLHFLPFSSRSEISRATTTHPSHQLNENMPCSQHAPIIMMTKLNFTYSTSHHSSQMLHGAPHSLSHSYNPPQNSPTPLMHNPYPNLMQSTSYNLLPASTS